MKQHNFNNEIIINSQTLQTVHNWLTCLLQGWVGFRASI